MRIRQALGTAVLVAAVVTPLTNAAVAEAAPVCTKTGTPYADVITGTAGADVLCGLGGGDTLKGVGGDDILIGGPGADTLQGGAGNDVLDGGDANDTLRGDDGADVMSGGLGVDLVRYDDRSTPVIVSVGRGADDGVAWGEGDDVRVDVERVYGGKANDRIVTFGAAVVQFYGRAGNDELIGGPAADLLQGDEGNDLLIGRESRDTYNCGLGNDSYRFDGTDVRQNGCEQLAQNRPPKAVENHLSTSEDVPLQVNADTLLANDIEPDNDPITLTSVGSPSHGQVVLSGSTITFTPEANFRSYASFYYSISDGELASTVRVEVYVESVNDPPVAVDDSLSTQQDKAVTISASALLANDEDVERVLILKEVGGATNGSVQLKDGYVTFTPTPGSCGAAGFDYTLWDGKLTDIGHVSVTVTCTPPPPPPPPPPHIITRSDTFYGTEDTQLVVPVSAVLANDTDVDGHPLTVVAVGGGYLGDAWLEGDHIVFQPDPDECNLIPGTSQEPAWFTYIVSDGNVERVGMAEVWLECVNDPPITWFQFEYTGRDTPLVLHSNEFAAFDIDWDVLTVVSVSNPLHGTVTVSDGVVTFVPEAGFCGDGGFDFTLSDGEYEATDHMYVNVWSRSCEE